MARPHQPDINWGAPTAHVDDSYPTLMPNGWAIGTFIFLTKVRSHGGAFIYYSGSPLRYRQGMAQSYHSIKEVAAASQYSGPFKEFLAEPGDVLFFHHLMGHTGSDNISDATTRHALLTRWRANSVVAPSLYALSGTSANSVGGPFDHRWFGSVLLFRRFSRRV